MAEFIPNPARGREVYDLDRNYVFHSWSAQGQITPLPIAGGSGSYFWDFDGKKYLDFSCQLVFTNIGFQHPKVIDAIKKQADLLTTIAPQAANEARGEAASRIVALASPSHEKVFFTNGGADGVENAIRMARIHTSRHKILSFYRSYHGNTTSAISATGDPRRWPNEFAYGHVHFFGPYLYRSAFWAKSEEEECERALQHLESVIEFEGPKTIAAILIESVVGTAGVLIPPKGYLEGVRRLCDKYGILWREVWMRAILIAFSMPSAPPLVKKTFSWLGLARATILEAASPRASFAACGAIVVSRSACFLIASITFGCWNPILVKTNWQEKSKYFFPSKSQKYEPLPPAIGSGVI